MSGSNQTVLWAACLNRQIEVLNILMHLLVVNTALHTQVLNQKTTRVAMVGFACIGAAWQSPCGLTVT